MSVDEADEDEDEEHTDGEDEGVKSRSGEGRGGSVEREGVHEVKTATWKDQLVGGYNEIKMYTVEEGSLRMKVNKKKKVRKHKQKLEDKIEEWKETLKDKPVVTNKLDESSPNYFYLYLTDRQKENIEKAKKYSAECVMKHHCKWKKNSTQTMMID